MASKVSAQLNSYFNSLQGKRSIDDYLTEETLPVLDRLMANSALQFIKEANNNLEKSGSVSTGRLGDELKATDVYSDGKTMFIEVGYPKGSAASKYYDFVNKGVKGYKSGQPNSPYKFKNIVGKNGVPIISEKFRSSIKEWIKLNAKGATTDTRYNKSKTYKKRKALSKVVKSGADLDTVAYRMAVGIKKKGLKKTGYFDKAASTAFGKDFAEAVAEAVGLDYRLGLKLIKKEYGDNNSK